MAHLESAACTAPRPAAVRDRHWACGPRGRFASRARARVTPRRTSPPPARRPGPVGRPRPHAPQPAGGGPPATLRFDAAQDDTLTLEPGQAATGRGGRGRAGPGRDPLAGPQRARAAGHAGALRRLHPHVGQPRARVHTGRATRRRGWPGRCRCRPPSGEADRARRPDRRRAAPRGLCGRRRHRRGPRARRDRPDREGAAGARAASACGRCAARPGLSNCAEASGSVIYVERVDPDGDGDAHFVLRRPTR